MVPSKLALWATGEALGALGDSTHACPTPEARTPGVCLYLPGAVILMALLALWGLTLNLSPNGRDGVAIEKLLKQVGRVIL